MKLVQVTNGEIKQHQLPKVGTLSDGSTVSGYHLLDVEILKAEGWLPLEDNPPTYDSGIEYLVADGYEILENKVIKKYKVEIIPEPEEYISLEEQILELQNALDIILGGEVLE